MVIAGLWTGVFVRPDFREATGDVSISPAADPTWFWNHVAFYGFISVVFWMVSAALLLIMAMSAMAAVNEMRKIRRDPYHNRTDWHTPRLLYSRRLTCEHSLPSTLGSKSP